MAIFSPTHSLPVYFESSYLGDMSIGEVLDLRKSGSGLYIDPSTPDCLEGSTMLAATTSSELYPKGIFYLYDHLGNTRVTFQPSGTSCVNVTNYSIRYLADYYPYGKLLRSWQSSSQEKYLSTQHERDLATGLDFRNARYYDSETMRFYGVDPLAGRYPSWSPYNFVFSNPLIFIDPDGRDPIYGKNFWGNVKLIGDDGKTDGKSYLVGGDVKRDVKSATKEGQNYTGALTEGKNVMNIPTGGVMEDVINSVTATEASQKENGGHANKGDASATRWDEGPAAHEVKDASGNVIGAKATLSPFNIGGSQNIPADASNVEFWWHTHPKTEVGGVQLGSSTPSQADLNFQGTMQGNGFKGNTFVIGVRSGKVTFFNSDGALMTVKYSDFKKMGGK